MVDSLFLLSLYCTILADVASRGNTFCKTLNTAESATFETAAMN
jgi:hypothetical protein